MAAEERFTRRGGGREAFLREAGRLYDEMMSRAGPASGDTFGDIEEQAEGVGRKLIVKMLRERLASEGGAGGASGHGQRDGPA